MPIPGPRTQHGPVLGYRNPGNEQPDRFNRWNEAGPVALPGRTPGLMVISLRGTKLAPGTVRRLWRQAVNYIPAQAPFSWTANGNVDGRVVPVGVTRALRYMTRSFYARAGTDNTRFAGLHTVIEHRNRYKPITVGAGQKRSAPTVRNRVSSFGSRVPTLNQRIPAAEDQPNG